MVVYECYVSQAAQVRVTIKTMADSDSEDGNDHWCVATADDFPPERKKNENKKYSSNNRYSIIQTVGGWAGYPREVGQCQCGQIPPGRSDSATVDRLL